MDFKTVHWRKLLWELLIVLIIAVIIFGLGAWFGHRFDRPPNRPKVTVNPTPKEEAKADLLMEQKLTGQSHTHVNRQPDPPESRRPPEDPCGGEEPQDPSWTFKPGDQIKYPWTGDLTIKLTDKRTGELLGNGVSPLSGETLITWDQTGFDVDTTFTAEITYGIDLPEQNPKRLEIGILAGGTTAGEAFAGVYGRYDVAQFQSRLINGAWWVGGAYLVSIDEGQGLLMTGIGIRF